MEFPNRVKCIEHYQSQFPNLPRYMIEMALDYDLENGGASNEKPKTGKEKRKIRQLKQKHASSGRQVETLEPGVTVESDSVSVVSESEYELPPFLPGYICVDGMEEVEKQRAEPEQKCA